MVVGHYCTLVLNGRREISVERPYTNDSVRAHQLEKCIHGYSKVVLDSTRETAGGLAIEQFGETQKNNSSTMVLENGKYVDHIWHKNRRAQINIPPICPGQFPAPIERPNTSLRFQDERPLYMSVQANPWGHFLCVRSAPKETFPAVEERGRKEKKKDGNVSPLFIHQCSSSQMRQPSCRQ